MTDTVGVFITSSNLRTEEIGRLIEEQGGWCETSLSGQAEGQRSVLADVAAGGAGAVVVGIMASKVLADVIKEVLRQQRFQISISVDEGAASAEWSGHVKSAADLSAEVLRVVEAIKRPPDSGGPLIRIQLEELRQAPPEECT